MTEDHSSTEMTNAQIGAGVTVQRSTKSKKDRVKRPNTLPDRFTDQKLKLCFANQFEAIVRYVPGMGWHRWSGTRWCTDLPGGLYPLIDQLQHYLMGEAAKIEDEDERLKQRKALIGLESHDRQTTVIKASEHVPKLITSANQLDLNDMLLNCLNGTVNLKTGRLNPHNPADMITRLITIEFDPAATCPSFVKFITWAMCDDNELVAYLQRFIGYCLTGSTSEQVLNFWYGTGSNGKTTLMNIIQWLLCDYATCADTGLIMKGDSAGTDSNKLYMLATLRGARLVTLSEVNDGQKLDEAAIKSFTGGDVVTARQIYQAPFSYTPQAKLIGFGNYKPHVSGTDHGIWRRIHLVPFKAVISDVDKDPQLPAKLRAELPGILTWAVRGCLEWQRVGLNPPKAILDAVQQYRRGEDTFQSWLSDCCSIGEGLRASAAALVTSFKVYSGWRTLSDKKFSEIMARNGFEKIRSNGMKWAGISLDENGRLEGLSPFSQKSLKENSSREFSEYDRNLPSFQLSIDDEVLLDGSGLPT